MLSSSAAKLNKYCLSNNMAVPVFLSRANTGWLLTIVCWPLFVCWWCNFLICCQPSASCRGGVHASNHSGQLHRTPGTSGSTHCGSSLCAHCCHCCCSEACTRCRGSSCYRCSLWGVPASSRHYRLWLSAATTWGCPATTACHLPELPGTTTDVQLQRFFK